MTKQKGFTLIELIIVIVILGALAVVALPRFIDLQDEARQSAVEGVAGALGSAAAVNYSGFLAGQDEDDGIISVSECSDTPSTLQGGEMPDGYDDPTSTNGEGGDDGESFECEVVHPEDDDATATFQAIAVDAS